MSPGVRPSPRSETAGVGASRGTSCSMNSESDRSGLTFSSMSIAYRTVSSFWPNAGKPRKTYHT